MTNLEELVSSPAVFFARVLHQMDAPTVEPYQRALINLLKGRAVRINLCSRRNT